MAEPRKLDMSVAVAILTYKRLDMLETALARCEAAFRAAKVRAILLVIDNDADETARPVVARFADRFDEIHYHCEPRRGIPVARNRALDEALALGADALCFIDDDEYPDPEWLARLVACWRETGADLVGGPVEVARPVPGAGLLQRIINASLAARMRRKNSKTARAAARKGRYTIITNNWLCDLAWQKRAKIRFDETLLISGGSDTAFYRAARKAGCETAWCPDALVSETIPLERLTFDYQFRRAADQSITRFRLKNPRVTPGVAILASSAAALRFLLGAALLVLPVFGAASPMMAIRSLGWSAGRLQALRGKKSELYK
ncbi:MAG: hypothetical protein CL534_15380 [Ahrensia sp.]|nr:hypothetical protein [Ahrensia sp.]